MEKGSKVATENDELSTGEVLVVDSGSLRPVLASLLIWTIAFLPVWIKWVGIALGADLHSHILLIPLVTGWLLITEKGKLDFGGKPSRTLGAGLVAVAISIACIAVYSSISGVDRVAMQVLAFVTGVWGICLACLGGRFVWSACFPLAFLFFMIPLPGFLEQGMEHLLMGASAWLSEWVFNLGGIPVHRQGQVLELPGIVLEVAQECSGIRSTLVLLITSVLASYLFLRSITCRIVLVAAVLPLGALRNAVRIYVIGWLCVDRGPEMIDSWIHRKGGPLFFVASLIPLLMLAWLLRRAGQRRRLLKVAQ